MHRSGCEAGRPSRQGMQDLQLVWQSGAGGKAGTEIAPTARRNLSRFSADLEVQAELASCLREGMWASM